MPSSVLSDGTIRRLVDEGRITIKPWDAAMVQPASVDLRLGNSFLVFHNFRVPAIDLADPPQNLTEQVVLDDGGSFVIHPGEFVLGRTQEYVELPDDLVARIEGKALALDTEVPTPDGWRTMGDLRPGDRVFGPDGAPLPVVAVSDVMTGRECREVVFSDGTTVVADLDHQWEVATRYDRQRGVSRVLTTREIEDAGVKQGKEYSFHVRQAQPLRYEDKALPVDPYVFGAWIGDGTSTKAEITCADPEILHQIHHCGVTVRRASGPLSYRLGGAGHTRDARTGRYVANSSLNSVLRAMGVFGRKHLPPAYLTASVHQRSALLTGLMDTDGYVDELGRCDLTTVKAPLAQQYHELVASLGFRPRTVKKRAMLDGRDCGPKYEIQFTPDRPVFRLQRKRLRQKDVGVFRRGRAIVAIRPTSSVPVRCIQVGAADGLFLVTRSCIPTHNSSLGRLGLIVHATAGFVDPGFQGTLTLEITNLTRVPIILWPGKPIAQLSFMTLDRPAERPYGHPDLGSHYQGQVEATESRYEGGPAGRSSG